MKQSILMVALFVIALFFGSCKESEPAPEKSKTDTLKTPSSSDQANTGSPAFAPQPPSGELPLTSSNYSLDDVLQKYYNAIGQEKLSQVKTLSQVGKISQPNGDSEFEMKFKRPFKVRMDIFIQGQKLIQAYDGKNAWAYAPFTGKNEPIDLQGDQVKQLEKQADFEGLLFNWKKKLAKLEPDGMDKVNGEDVYRLKATKKEGSSVYVYLSTKTHFLIKTAEQISTPQGSGLAEITYSKYKSTSGINMPYEVNFSMNGQSITKFKFDKIEFNAPIDDAVFSKSSLKPE